MCECSFYRKGHQLLSDQPFFSKRNHTSLIIVISLGAISKPEISILAQYFSLYINKIDPIKMLNHSKKHNQLTSNDVDMKDHDICKLTEKKS